MENTEIYVAHTLESGVEPIEMRFLPLYDCYYHRVIGYTGQGYINSVLYGTLPPAEYLPALETDPLGADFAIRCLKNTLAALRATKTNLFRVEYVGVLCPISLLRDARLYDRLAAIAGREESTLLQKIHLEFDCTLLSMEKELLKTAFSDVRAAGFRISVRGYGTPGFPMTALIDTAPDAVYLSALITALLSDREKAAAAPAFARFAGSMEVQVIAEGVSNDGQIRELNSAECAAFLPAASYRGAYRLSCEEKKLPRLLTEREEADGDE